MKRIIAIVCASAVSSTGCTLPIALYPAAAVGSGKAVEIVDEHGRLVEQDGILVVNRSYNCDFPQWLKCGGPSAGLAHIRGAPTSRVIPIKGGKATIPYDIDIETVTLRSHEFAPLCLAMPFIAPQNPINIFAPIGAFIPQLQVYPNETLWLIPLMPGYHLPLEERQLRLTTTLQNLRGVLWQFEWPNTSPPLPDGPFQLLLRSDDGSSEDSLAYWQYVHQRMRKRYQRQPDDNGPDLRLESFRFDRLHRYVTSEIRRRQSAAATSQPKPE